MKLSIRPRGRLLTLLCLAAVASACASSTPSPATGVDDYLRLLNSSEPNREAVLRRIADTWHPGSAVMLVESLSFLGGTARAAPVVELLERQTGQSLGYDIQAWYDWIWRQEAEPHPLYADFKSRLYRNIDPRFEAYFSPRRASTIRLDEVRWGGVRQDGIPPLRSPVMIAAAEAAYLDDEHIVFGIEVEGDARAYPKRILAWHEMFVDVVGGLPVAGVYCTLCGTVILYETEVDGVLHEMGTSGFLYRSNKLMYDRATQSLWNTLWGRPVIGPLAEREIELPRRSVVTTTWGEWRRRHPQTTVLALDTGYRRDYSEGAAYRDYFATDELMFNVSLVDDRLANKAEVLGLIFPAQPDSPLAIAQDFLVDHPLHHDAVGDLRVVVLTDPSGANRVYATEGRRFVSWDGDRSLTDEGGEGWTLSEDHLQSGRGVRLLRLPSQRAFWFGWYASYPHTRLVR